MFVSSRDGHAGVRCIAGRQILHARCVMRLQVRRHVG
jgi:hypothetical protein